MGGYMTNYESQLIKMIKSDHYIMSALEAVDKLKLNDAWIAAGLIRNKVWDELHHKTTPTNDIDVIYFNSFDTSMQTEKGLEGKLEVLLPNQPWSVKNQARMHLKNKFDSFQSSYDGVAHFPETPTAIAVQLYRGNLKIMAPYGLENLFEMIVKPTPAFQKNTQLHSVYSERMRMKKWTEIWSQLSIEK